MDTKTNNTRETLKATFLLGFSGILKVSDIKNKILTEWSSITAFVGACLVSALCLIFKLDVLKLLLEFKNLMLNFLPAILGFTIAGYSLMVGFIRPDILDKITEPLKDSKFSLYQKLSATFALNVMIQAIALIIAYLVHLVNYFDTNRGLKFDLPSSYLCWFNNLALFFSSFWFFLSLLMIVQIIINIFGFSQLHHYFINKFKIELQEKEEEKANNPNQ